MAALMRQARFCSTTFNILKVLRIANPNRLYALSDLLSNGSSAVKQRSWNSTVAKEAPADSEAGSSKVDVLMNSLERYMRQFGRISRKQLDPVVTSMEKEGSISVSSSLALLRLYGSAMFDEPPANRLRLTEELWQKFKKFGVQLEVSHYNTLLAVYIQNKLKFSPADILADMKDNGITPNRVTYQRMIARFCEDGDLSGATRVLEHMKAQSMPVNDQVFNSFITGHLRSNDPENAKNILEVMRQAGLEPTNTTYMTLAVGFAERGEVEEVKKYIKQAEVENVSLRPGQLLEIISALVTSGHSQLIEQVFSYLHQGGPFNQDAIRVCNQLISLGYDEAAYKLFLEMPKPTRVDVDQTTLGRFFLRALARNTRPLDKVVEIVKDMQVKEINKDDLSAVAHLAYLEKQHDYALKVIEKMKSEGLPVRTHYFWPAFSHYRETKDSKGVYQALEKMVALSDARDDFTQSLHRYIIPALLASGATETEIISNLQKLGFEEKVVNFAFFLQLLDSGKLKEANELLEKRPVTVSIVAARACLQSLFNRPMEWRTVLPMAKKLKENSSVWGGVGLETTSFILRQVMVSLRKADWAEAQEVFDYMQKNNLWILPRSQLELAEYFAGAPNDVLQRLSDLVTKDRPERESTESLSNILSLEELKQLQAQNPNNKTIQKRLLLKACSTGNVEEAEKLRTSMEAEGFVFSPNVLSQLVYLYATFAKDLEKAQDYLQRLETQFPEHHGYQSAVLKLAALQAAKGSTDVAVETLQRYADRHMKGKDHEDIKREDYYTDVINNAVGAESAKKLLSTFIACGYGSSDLTSVLEAYMDKVLDSGDGSKILQEFEDIVKTHNKSPQVDKVLQFFIRNEDPDKLQKVVDLLTAMHGLMNVFHHLIADFIECGHVKKAKKIMETPGLRAVIPRLNYYCQSFIERNLFKELEMLVEVTKDMFGVDRDNMLFHLIRGYVKQKELQKAQDVLVRYEEEMIQPSTRTLRFLARGLERANMPVPFHVPELQPLPDERIQTSRTQQQTESAVKQAAENIVVKGKAIETTVAEKKAVEVQRSKAASEKAAYTSKLAPAVTVKPNSVLAEQLKKSLEQGEVDKVLATLQSNEKKLLSDAINIMKKPWPVQALQATFDSLGKQGDMDTLALVIERRLPVVLKSSLRASIFLAAVNTGRGSEVVDKMEKVTSNAAKFLSFQALEVLSSKSPQLLDRVENLAKKFKAEKDYVEPLSIVWSFYKFMNSPRAEEILKENSGFEKTVLPGLLCQMAALHNKVDLIESVIKMKQEASEKQGMALAYSHLLNLYESKGDVDKVEKTFGRIIKDDIARNHLRNLYVEKAEALLIEKGRPLPKLVELPSSSSSESDSASSSEEEPNKKTK